tara:strand:+ start:1410 stop:2408 length:999 start_codon:yes stop_codon:yes gene_type:complete
MSKLRKLFTNSEVFFAINSTENDRAAAVQLSNIGRGTISKQLMRYWRRQLTEVTKRNGEPYAGNTVLNRKIRDEEITLRNRSINDDDRTSKSRENNRRILIIPDQHAPYHHQDALEFLIAVAAKIKPTRVVNLGDETDGHALSMHDSDPSLDSAGVELTKARKFIGAMERIFPVMDICHSNHGSLVYRRAFKSGIPTEYIKSYREILFPSGRGQGWEWKDKHRITLPNGEDVIFQHQSAGDTLNNAGHERASIVEGHEHGKFEIQYRSSTTALYWSLISGCLIDPKALAFAYGKLFPKKPLLGCSVIIDSIPRLIPMELDEGGRWTGKLNGL